MPVDNTPVTNCPSAARSRRSTASQRRSSISSIVALRAGEEAAPGGGVDIDMGDLLVLQQAPYARTALAGGGAPGGADHPRRVEAAQADRATRKEWRNRVDIMRRCFRA